jgi:hypothetical protein
LADQIAVWREDVELAVTVDLALGVVAEGPDV